MFIIIIITSFLSSDRGLGPDHPDAHVLVPLPLASSDLGLDLVPDLQRDVTLALEAGPSLRGEEGKTAQTLRRLNCFTRTRGNDVLKFQINRFLEVAIFVVSS